MMKQTKLYISICCILMSCCTEPSDLGRCPQQVKAVIYGVLDLRGNEYLCGACPKTERFLHFPIRFYNNSREQAYLPIMVDSTSLYCSKIKLYVHGREIDDFKLELTDDFKNRAIIYPDSSVRIDLVLRGKSLQKEGLDPNEPFEDLINDFELHYKKCYSDTMYSKKQICNVDFIFSDSLMYDTVIPRKKNIRLGI